MRDFVFVLEVKQEKDMLSAQGLTNLFPLPQQEGKHLSHKEKEVIQGEVADHSREKLRVRILYFEQAHWQILNQGP